jgi:hypothetical protein
MTKITYDRVEMMRLGLVNGPPEAFYDTPAGRRSGGVEQVVPGETRASRTRTRKVAGTTKCHGDDDPETDVEG